MKPIIAICCYLLLVTTAYSQTEVNPNEISSENYGNPYIIREWSAGNIKFTSGRVVTQFKLRFDCVRNQLLLQFQGSTFAAESKVKEFVMYTGAKKKDSLVFRKGYPAIDKSTNDTYYHVLLEDKVQFLRLISKNIVEEKELIATNRTNKGRLEDDEKYYLVKDGKLILLPSEKEEFVKAFPEHNDALLAFANENKLRFKSYEDYAAVAKKYNELIK